MKKKNIIIGALSFVALAVVGASAFATVATIDNAPSIVNAADYSNYWSSVTTDGTVTGNTFRKALQDVMISKGTQTGKNSYKELNTILAKSDADPNDSSKILPFYRSPSESVKPSWNSNINKEHTWPNSRGAGENKGYAGTDPQVIRPTLTNDNSNRGNSMFAASGAYDPGCLGYESARGEAARIILYAATRYYGLSTASAGGSSSGSNPLELTNNVNESASNHTMGKLSDLLKWNAEYPVTAAEKYRNDYLTGINYARNPFIDHPDWANYIWDENGIRTSSYTPSSEASGGGTTSTNPNVTTYTLVNGADGLEAGKKYVIAGLDGSTYHAACTSMVATYYISQMAVPGSGNVIEHNPGIGVFSLENGTTDGTYAFKDTATSGNVGYLNGTVSGTHYNVAYTTSKDSSTNWNITFATNGSVTMKNANNVTLKYDPTHTDFTGTSGTASVYLFRLNDGSYTPSSSNPTSSSTAATSVSSNGQLPTSEEQTNKSGCQGEIIGTLGFALVSLGAVGVIAFMRKKTITK